MFGRRWSVGSDDMVVAAVFLAILHLVWIAILSVVVVMVRYDENVACSRDLRDHALGYLVILSGCVIIEGCIAFVSMRGTILVTKPRASMQYLLYIRLLILVVEVVWLIMGVVWIVQHYASCSASVAKRAVLGIVICNWTIVLCVLFITWCTFDSAGRSWVKMKHYQDNMHMHKHSTEHAHHLRQVNEGRRRSWRQRICFFSLAPIDREAILMYEQSWYRRCTMLFCCLSKSRYSGTFDEVTKLLAEFFRDLDVVPSDIVAGLMLLRKQQKRERMCIVSQKRNDVYQFLSGVAITPHTKFVSLKNPKMLAEFKAALYYLHYSIAAYGWPIYLLMHRSTGCCKLLPSLRCCGCCCCCCCVYTRHEYTHIIDDNCCSCHLAAIRKLSGLDSRNIVYANCHVEVGETSFFIALDHDKRKVIISIRGTLSLKDILTDLQAECEVLPVTPKHDEWLGHKGMVQAALYIKRKLQEEGLLSQAFSDEQSEDSSDYGLVIVGHSLGAGTAAILAILLHENYPSLHCYAYAPPGGLLSATCVEDTKSFITSVVVGKDVVTRMGLYQMESLRQDVLDLIKKSSTPKWQIIGTIMCCLMQHQEEERDEEAALQTCQPLRTDRRFIHPMDSRVGLTTHTPLFPPGKIIHVVRSHPKNIRGRCHKEKPVYQAIYTRNIDFDEVLISPTMLTDHLATNILKAMEKVLTNMSPTKPVRRLPESERRAQLSSLLEEDELDLSHQVGDSLCTNGDFSQSIGVFNDISDSSNCESIMPQHATSLRTKTPPSTSSQRPEFTLDLLSDDWVGHAPLATPETLSETSSFGSLASLQRQSSLQGDHARVKTEFVKLETITQSPLRQSHADGSEYLMKEPLAHSTPAKVDHTDSPGFPVEAWPTPIRIPVVRVVVAPVHCGTAVNSCADDEVLFDEDVSRTESDVAPGGMTNGHDQTPPGKCSTPLGNGLPARPAEGAAVCPDTDNKLVCDMKPLNVVQSLRGCKCEKKYGTPEKGRLRRTYSDGPSTRAMRKAHALHNGGVTTHPPQCNGSGSRHSEGDVAWSCDGTKCSWPIVCENSKSRTDDHCLSTVSS